MHLCLDREDAVLRAVTEAVGEALSGTAGCGIALGAPCPPAVSDRLATAVASDVLVERADELQYGLGEGPCLTAYRERVLVSVEEMWTEERWPRWARAAERLGLRSVLTTPLAANGEVLGVLEVCSRRPAAYGVGEAHALRLFAAQTAVLLAGVRDR